MHFDFKARTDYINDVEKFEYSFKGTFNPKLAAARNEYYDAMNIYNSPPPNSSLYLYHYKINDSIFYQLKNGLYEFYAKNYDKSRKDYHSGLRNKLLISANNKLLIAYLKYDLELLKNFFEKHNLEKDNINTFSPKEIELEGPGIDFVVDEVTGENHQNGNTISKKKFYVPPHSYYIKKSYDSLIENLNLTINYICTNLSLLGYDSSAQEKPEPAKKTKIKADNNLGGLESILDYRDTGVISEFCNYLISNKYLHSDTKHIQLNNLFVYHKLKKPINWIASNNKLGYFVSELMGKGIIQYSLRPRKEILKTFRWRGKEINGDTFSCAGKEIKSDPVIDQAINILSKQ